MRVSRYSGALAAIAAVALAAALVRAQTASGTSPRGLSYEATGAGAPVVFIHAFSVDRRMWQPQIERFERAFRVIRYDLRGHGKSAAPGEPYTSYDDLLSVLDALKIERATLVGLSAGSEVATDFALAYPNRVSRMVLTSPGLGGYQVPPLPWATPVFQAAGAGDAQKAAQLWSETPIMALRANTAAMPTITSMVMDNWRLWTYRRTEQRLSPPAVTRLSDIKVPVLVVTGDADLPHIKEIAGVLVRDIPGAKLASIPRAGHFVNLDTPSEFNDAVGAFLAAR